MTQVYTLVINDKHIDFVATGTPDEINKQVTEFIVDRIDYGWYPDAEYVPVVEVVPWRDGYRLRTKNFDSEYDRHELYGPFNLACACGLDQ